ncbi:MAG: alpha/beta hydrolase-fold protein [Bacteroidota bacterium]
MKHIILLYTCILFILSGCKKTVEDSFSAKSDSLNTEIEVIIRETGNSDQNQKPIVYFTDGEEILNHGVFEKIDSATEADSLPAAYYVFVGSMNGITDTNEREKYFFCNEEYLSFFENEIIKAVESRIGRSFSPDNRSLAGISFGGMNAAFFAAQSNAFNRFAMLSPITYPCTELNAKIAFSERKDLNIYISSGHNDAETYAKPLVEMFNSKGYHVEFIETTGGHDFDNWNTQWVHMLKFLHH